MLQNAARFWRRCAAFRHLLHETLKLDKAEAEVGSRKSDESDMALLCCRTSECDLATHSSCLALCNGQFHAVDLARRGAPQLLLASCLCTSTRHAGSQVGEQRVAIRQTSWILKTARCESLSVFIIASCRRQVLQARSRKLGKSSASSS